MIHKEEIFNNQNSYLDKNFQAKIISLEPEEHNPLLLKHLTVNNGLKVMCNALECPLVAKRISTRL